MIWLRNMEASEGVYSAERIVVLGDGAKWIKRHSGYALSHAIQIVDLYHAREHMSDWIFCEEKKVVFASIKWWTYLDWEWLKRL